MSVKVRVTFLNSSTSGDSGVRPRKTVCQILHGMDVGGAEILAARLAQNLQESFRFVFVCLDKLGSLGERMREMGFPVHVLQRRDGLDWRCIRTLRLLLDHERVDVIHAHQYTPFVYSSTSRMGFERRVPILFTEHGRHHPDYPRRKRILANRLLLRHDDHVVAVGEAVRAALICNEGLPPNRVQVIYNGIPLEHFQSSQHERNLVRAELGIPSEALVLIQVARLSYLKNHATALRTLDRVIRQRPDAQLLFIGEGPERGSIEMLINRLGLHDHVQMLGSRDDVARLLAAADVAILTSISEGLPLTLIEAMASGLPVVATRVGGVSEVVDESRTGLLAPSEDFVALSSHLLRLASDDEAKVRMGEHGRERAFKIFSEVRMQNQYSQLYLQLTSIEKR